MQDYNEVLKHANEKSTYASSQGIIVEEFSLGESRVVLHVTEAVLNHWGTVHGGALYTLADMAAGVAASSYGDKVVTVDSSFSFIRPGKEGDITARGEVIKHGKSLTFVRVSIEDEDKNSLCEGIFTFASLGER